MTVERHPFLPIFDRPNSIGEINCFLRTVVLQNGNSLLTGAESRVTLSYIFPVMEFLNYFGDLRVDFHISNSLQKYVQPGEGGFLRFHCTGYAIQNPQVPPIKPEGFLKSIPINAGKPIKYTYEFGACEKSIPLHDFVRKSIPRNPETLDTL